MGLKNRRFQHQSAILLTNSRTLHATQNAVTTNITQQKPPQTKTTQSSAAAKDTNQRIGFWVESLKQTWVSTYIAYSKKSPHCSAILLQSGHQNLILFSLKGEKARNRNESEVTHSINGTVTYLIKKQSQKISKLLLKKDTIQGGTRKPD